MLNQIGSNRPGRNNGTFSSMKYTCFIFSLKFNIRNDKIGNNIKNLAKLNTNLKNKR